MEKIKEKYKSIILIDKPSGISSFDCIRKLRPIIEVSKMGHAGTLDPLATGLMIIGVGKEGTRSLNDFKNLEKNYQVTALLGVSTTTGDTEGEIEEEREVSLDIKEVKKAVFALEGEKNLLVPLYSAIKKKGKPLYWYARKGIPVEVPYKTMVVKRADFEDFYEEKGKKYIRFQVKVSSGTYVRSLVEELGRVLGVPATVSALRRTAIGSYSLEKAYSLKDIEAGTVKIDHDFTRSDS